MSLTSSHAARRVPGPSTAESASGGVADEPNKRLRNLQTEFSWLYRSLENEKLAHGMLILQLKRVRQGLDQQLELARRGVAAAASTIESSSLVRKLDDDDTVAGLFAAQVKLRGKLDAARRDIKAMRGRLQDAALERAELMSVKAALQAINDDSVVTELQARVDTLQAGIDAADAVWADQAVLARDAEGRRVERHGELLRARNSLHCRASCKRQLALQLTAAAKAERTSDDCSRGDEHDGSSSCLGDPSGSSADGVGYAGDRIDATTAAQLAAPPHDEARRRIQTALLSFDDLAAPLTRAVRSEVLLPGVLLQPARGSAISDCAFVLRSDRWSVRQPRGASRPGSSRSDSYERRAAGVSVHPSRQAQRTDGLMGGSGCGGDADRTSSGFMTSPREFESLEDGPCAVATVDLSAEDVRVCDTRMSALLGQDWGDASANCGKTDSVGAALTLAPPDSVCAGDCSAPDSPPLAIAARGSTKVHAALNIIEADHAADGRCYATGAMPKGGGECSNALRQARLSATLPDLGPWGALCAATSVVLAPKHERQRSLANRTLPAFPTASGPVLMTLDRGSSGYERNLASAGIRGVGAVSLTTVNPARSETTEAAAGAGGRTESLVPICRSTSSLPVPSRATHRRSPSFSRFLQASNSAHDAHPPSLERARAAPTTPLLSCGSAEGDTAHTRPSLGLGIRGVTSLPQPTTGQRAVRVGKHAADVSNTVAAGLPPLPASTAARRGLSTGRGFASSMTRPRVVTAGSREPTMGTCTGKQPAPTSQCGDEVGESDRLFFGGTVGAFAPMSSRTDGSDVIGTLGPADVVHDVDAPGSGRRDSREDAPGFAEGLEPWAMASHLASLMLTEPTASDAFAGRQQLPQ
jgi:hypothetical protein